MNWISSNLAKICVLGLLIGILSLASSAILKDFFPILSPLLNLLAIALIMTLGTCMAMGTKWTKPTDLTPKLGTLQIKVQPAEDLDGQWVAKVQPVGIVTQGNDMVHAIRMAAEAVEMCLEDDLEHGLNFWNRCI